MDEREVGLLDSHVRRALRTLDAIEVPPLAAVRASRQAPPWRAPLSAGGIILAVVVAALALGQLLATFRSEQVASQAMAAPALSAPPTPLPTGVVDPQPLVQGVRGMTAVVHRVDEIATKLVSSSDYVGAGVSFGPGANVPARVWVVAVVGEVSPAFGVMATQRAQCGLFAFDAETGASWSSSVGPLALCRPYFGRSLTSPDRPVRCAPMAYDNGVPRNYRFSATTPGRVLFTSVRDNAWRQSAMVPGSFLAEGPEGSVLYEGAFCLRAFVRQGPSVERLLASGVGADPGSPRPDFAIWLRGYHAVSGSADTSGDIDVVVEPRAGYEWAYFDWHALVPGGGYVMFRFVDASGNEILPWRLANGP